MRHTVLPRHRHVNFPKQGGGGKGGVVLRHSRTALSCFIIKIKMIKTKWGDDERARTDLKAVPGVSGLLRSIRPGR